MKTCPNCGSKMDADVNFCTTCGTDIRNVPLDAPEMNTNAKPVQNMEQPMQPQPTQNFQQPVQPQMQQPIQNQNIQQANVSSQPSQANQTFAQMGQAIKNFDRKSLWNWYTTSWKTPSAKQNGEKWYGIATLIVELILLSWPIASGVKKLLYSTIPTAIPSEIQNRFNSFFQGLGIDLFLWFLIAFVGTILGSYFIHKFIYNESADFLQYTNKIVQLSNVNIILALAIAILSIIDFKDTAKFVAILTILLTNIFTLAGAIAMKEDRPGNKDYFYGVIIYMVIVIAANVLAMFVVKGQLVSQVQNAFQVDISKYFNLSSMLTGH